MTETAGRINIERDVNIHLEDRKRSRHFFWFLWVMYVVVCMTKNCYGGAMASIVAEGVMTKSQTGFITAMFYIVYTPLQIVGGLMVDRYSPEKLIKIGLLGGAIANIVIFFNQNYYVMLIAWSFNAATQFGIWPATFKIISSQLVRSDRKTMAFYVSFSATGGTFLSYLIAALVTKWQYNFLVSAVALLVFAVVMHIYDRHLNPYMIWDKKETESESKGAHFPNISTKNVILASGFGFILVYILLSVVVSRSRETLAPVILADKYTLSPALANSLNLFMIAAGIVGTIVANKLVSKIRNMAVGVIAVLAIMIPFLIICSFVGQWPMYTILVSMCIVSALQSVLLLMNTTYNMNFSKYNKSGTIAGLSNSAQAFAYIIAAYIIPLVQEKFGWGFVMNSWSVLIGISIISMLFAIGKVRSFSRSL